MFRRVTACLPPTHIVTRCLAVTGRHSKNVAGKKNRLDAAKNKLYTRLGVKILMATKSGGTNPEQNVELARVLREATAAKLPKENIERALAKASDASEGAGYTSGVYEVFGHGGVGLVVCTLTDNSNRANMGIKALARKSEVKIASSGSVLFQFEHKAIFTPNGEIDKDALVEAAIEGDMDDVDFRVNNLDEEIVVADVSQLGLLQDVTAKLQLDGVSSMGYLPTELVSVSEDDFEKNTILVEAFEDLDDVDAVYHNMSHNVGSQ